MCGRFALDDDLNALYAAFDLREDDLDQISQALSALGWSPATVEQTVQLPRYSIAPTNQIPIVLARESDHATVTGLIPAIWGWERSWSQRTLINATREKLLTSRTWKNAALSRRAIIPMTGYYEWVLTGTVKIPHFVHASSLLAAAGIWEVHDGQVFVTMITSEGTDQAGEVHPRMPLFVGQDLTSEWLDPHPLDDDEASHLLANVVQASAEISKTISTHEVSRNISYLARLDPRDASLIAAVN